MHVKLNPTGIHIRNGFLVVRLDLYPDETSRTYAGQYVPHFDREPTAEELADRSKLALIPTHLELNPCLCHFITVPELFSPEDIESYVHAVFDPDTLATLDNCLVLPGSAHLVSPLMRARGRFAANPIRSGDATDLVNSVIDRFRNLVVPLDGNGSTRSVEPESIDLGIVPGNFNDDFLGGWSLLQVTNPANADGTLDTIQVYYEYDATGVKVGTEFLVSGTMYECRDTHTIGNVSSGSTQTFSGITGFNVVAGDFIVIFCATGIIERNLSGYDGVRAIAGTDVSNVSTQGDFDWLLTGNGMALYATGEEGGGVTARTSSETGAGVDSRLSLLAGLVRADTGGGSEGVIGRGLARHDSGGVSDGARNRGLASGDAGLGVDVGMIPGQENLSGSDAGSGGDALKALVATSVGADMKLPGRQGRVTIPSKGVSL